MGNANFTYDANGNLTSDGSRTFTYDVENRLVGASGGVQLGYDPLGRLAWTTGSPNFTRFLYDPGSGSGAGADALVAEYDYSGNLVRRYVHGGGVDEPFLLYEGSGVAHTNLRLLFADRQGSIVAVTDYWGNGIAVNRYDEYGIPASTNSGRFQYTGQIWLPELGMYHYKARVYSPSLGRFLQVDPIGYDDQFNLYAYVGNDPVNGSDPTGEATETCGSRLGISASCSGETILGLIGDWRAKAPPGPHSHNWNRSSEDEEEEEEEEDGLASLVPGHAAYKCTERGCGFWGWLGAAVDVTPFGRIGTVAKVGRWGVRALRGCGCLEAGTLVATPDGLRPIEDISVGDLVLAMNETTVEIGPRRVTDLIRPDPKPLYALRLLDREGESEVFHATDDHPWRTQGRGWIETVDLRPGDRIDTAGADDLVVASLEITSRIERTYNLTVADWHTFLIGENGAVVHNACREIVQAARRLGYTVDRSIRRQHGQEVFRRGTRYISRDVDQHLGGAWKTFEMRGGRLVRTGTWNDDLTVRLGN